MPRRKSRRKLDESIEAFAPDAIWLDGLWPGAFAISLAKLNGLQYFYRSHNIEHRYMARQAALASSMSYRVRLLLTRIGLQRFERKVVLGASRVFDISIDDLTYWKSRGLGCGTWLPPIVPVRALPEAAAGSRCDIAFLGNLHTPNNVEAVKWLLLEVWPLLRSVRPLASAIIAGFAPSEEVRALVADCAGVTLLADPPDVWPLYAAARVLVNPARSGSGVNIKSVEMLQLDSPIVSTSVGVGGLPESIRAQFLVADNAEDFARAINDALSGKVALDRPARERARDMFAPQAINEVVRLMKADIAADVRRS
jgi:glycosyltransferase involved in cell wall biosynthesis